MTDNIPALERALSDAYRAYGQAEFEGDEATVRGDLRKRIAEARARLAAARKPKPLTADEGLAILRRQSGFTDLAMQAVLDAAHERTYRVIEVLLGEKYGCDPAYPMLTDIRAALGVKP